MVILVIKLLTVSSAAFNGYPQTQPRYLLLVLKLVLELRETVLLAINLLTLM